VNCEPYGHGLTYVKVKLKHLLLETEENQKIISNRISGLRADIRFRNLSDLKQSANQLSGTFSLQKLCSVSQK
jgi:hypothetical protein